MSRAGPVTGVRVRDGEFEGRCEYCGEWLPLTADFWPVRVDARGWTQGLRRCKACLREYKRLRQQGYRGSIRQALWRANARAHYRAMPIEERERRNAYNRAWKAAHREHVAAYNRTYRERAA